MSEITVLDTNPVGSFFPQPGYAVVRREKVAAVSEGGILLVSEDATERHVVEAVSWDKSDEDNGRVDSFGPGDEVIISPNARLARSMRLRDPQNMGIIGTGDVVAVRRVVH